MAVRIHRLECPIDIESGHPDQASYTFDMPVLPAVLGAPGLVGVEYKMSSHHILAICDRVFTGLNLAISTTFTWRLTGQESPIGGLFLGATIAEGTGDTIFWFKV
jgi:hypothetical protein